MAESALRNILACTEDDELNGLLKIMKSEISIRSKRRKLNYDLVQMLNEAKENGLDLINADTGEVLVNVYFH